MNLSLIAGFALMLSAICLGVIERAIGPNHDEFPCVPMWVRINLRIATIGMVIPGIKIIYRQLFMPMPHSVPPGIIIMSMTLLLALGSMLYALINVKLPSGTWNRLNSRRQRAKVLANSSPFPEVGAALARLEADATSDSFITGPNESIGR